MAAALLWRYSLRWGLPHRPCPGPHELAAAEVPAGQQCPPEVANLWRPGTGYVVCIDFPPGWPGQTVEPGGARQGAAAQSGEAPGPRRAAVRR